MSDLDNNPFEEDPVYIRIQEAKAIMVDKRMEIFTGEDYNIYSGISEDTLYLMQNVLDKMMLSLTDGAMPGGRYDLLKELSTKEFLDKIKKITLESSAKDETCDFGNLLDRYTNPRKRQFSRF